jgi:hypothetical protein
MNNCVQILSFELNVANGSPTKGATMLTTLQSLVVMPSFSRPALPGDAAGAPSFW